VSAELLKRLIEAGTPAELVAEVATQLAEARADVRALENKRSYDREYQRERRKSRTTSHESNDVVEIVDTPTLDKTTPQTPLKTKPSPTPPYSPPASQKRGTRLSDDFEPPEDWIAWAMKKRGWGREEALDECECFIRYWQAKPGREACKLDWPKTWQNWAVNSRRTSTPARIGAWDGMA
jgi:hypothetical protein